MEVDTRQPVRPCSGIHLNRLIQPRSLWLPGVFVLRVCKIVIGRLGCHRLFSGIACHRGVKVIAPYLIC